MNGKMRLAGWYRRLCGGLLLLALFCATPWAWADVLLWEVTGGSAPVWLFGSVHLCRVDCFPLPRAVEARFSKAAVLAVELDPTQPGVAAALFQNDEGGGNLRFDLSEAEWGSLKRQLQALEMPESAMERLTPNIASLMVTFAAAQRVGLLPLYGTDLHFLDRAKRGGKRLVELETAEQQVRALNAGSRADSLNGLRAIMAAVDDGSLNEVLGEMVAAWQAGDAERLEETLQKAEQISPSSESFTEAMYGQRNRRMSESIARLARKGEPAFVVVGSGHLVGRDSIPALLARQGFKVRQLKTSERP